MPVLGEVCAERRLSPIRPPPLPRPERLCSPVTHTKTICEKVSDLANFENHGVNTYEITVLENTM